MDKIFETFKKTAIDTLLKNQTHIPQLIIKTKRGITLAPITEQPDTSEERQKQIFIIGQGLARNIKEELQEVSFTSEAWSSSNTTTRPSEAPDKKEVLLIMYFNAITKQNNFSMFEMIRNKKGKITGTKEMEMGKPEDVKSPLLDAFIAGYSIGFEEYQKMN